MLYLLIKSVWVKANKSPDKGTSSSIGAENQSLAAGFRVEATVVKGRIGDVAGRRRILVGDNGGHIAVFVNNFNIGFFGNDAVVVFNDESGDAFRSLQSQTGASFIKGFWTGNYRDSGISEMT